MICFDLEGPLSPQDNAYEVMKLSENGGSVFEALSKYDDYLALEERAGYEPGDTLKLIVPFLVHYGISGEDIKKVSSKAGLLRGMADTVRWIRKKEIPLRVISTSYQQHAHTIGKKLGIASEEIACTRLELENIRIPGEVMSEIEDLENELHSTGLTQAAIKRLDAVYFSDGLFEQIDVKVVGGQRKVDAMLNFAKVSDTELDRVIAIGDSITDYKMLKTLKERGGLAIAFNANEYCLPYADIALATMDGGDLIPIFESFRNAGKEAAIEKVDEFEKCSLRGFRAGRDTEGPVYTNLMRTDIDIKKVLEVHKNMRVKVRGEAGKLG